MLVSDTVNMEITKTEGVIKCQAIFVADGIPRRDQTSIGISDNVGVRVNIEMSPVRTMGILTRRERHRG